jgi:guanosine-3',5'-bis(diphosphate) 3'-pyrophosphohydrolase
MEELLVTVESELARVLKAAHFAAEKHRLQRRKDAEASPYINHPLALAQILCAEGKVTDPDVIVAALLHDTVEDTDTTSAEIETEFGSAVARIVAEVTDDKSLPKGERKRLQVVKAASKSAPAKLVKLADKISNLRDIAASPPSGWSTERRENYFHWAKEVVGRMRGVHAGLEAVFDQTYIQGLSTVRGAVAAAAKPAA